MKQRERETSVLVEMSRYLGAGLTWVFATVLFLLLGRLADGWLGTYPWLALVGAFVGAAAGFYAMLRQLMPRGPGAPERGGGGGDDQGADGGRGS